jgi:hypothetical protein
MNHLELNWRDKGKVTGNAKSGKLEIKGLFCPENTETFFAPLHHWAENYPLIAKKQELEVLFKILLCNKSTKKQFYKLIRVLDELCQQGFAINIYWFYEEDDEDSEEDGEDIRDYYAKACNFRLVEVEDLEQLI